MPKPSTKTAKIPAAKKTEVKISAQASSADELRALKAGLLQGEDARAAFTRGLIGMAATREKTLLGKMDEEIAKGGNGLADMAATRRRMQKSVERTDNWLAALAPPAGIPDTPQARLFLAAAEDDAEGVAKAVADGAELDAVNAGRVCALGLAASRGRRAAFDKLVKLGAKKLWDADDAVRPALTLAAESGNATAVELLLSAGVDPDTQSASGDSALGWALGRGQKDCAKLLRAAGAKEPEKKVRKTPNRRPFGGL